MVVYNSLVVKVLTLLADVQSGE